MLAGCGSVWVARLGSLRAGPIGEALRVRRSALPATQTFFQTSVAKRIAVSYLDKKTYTKVAWRMIGGQDDNFGQAVRSHDNSISSLS